jgi:DNA repair exonuclease SbcCD ATPase subunit
MAIRDIANSRSSLSFDFLMADEIVDGLDETGMNEFFKLLRNIEGQKLVISHNDELKALFSSVIKVVRNNGISYIKTAA